MEPRIDLLQNELGTKLAKRMFAVHSLVQQTGLPAATQNLVMLRASQINGCGHCIDIHAKEAAAEGETTTRLNLVAGWRHSTVFTEEEQAALAMAEEATRLADASEGVSEETWARAAKYYDENQLIGLVTLIAMINASNRIAVTLNQLGGSYEPGLMAATISS
ncbi:carboxymuconolactone decarboxylase family protein [Kribbella sp. VKM Ac-2566]|uniref:carboxymuconolactone decarboxylase family protein n=1 Tax=Kribbella sp. VKM Ac-2566 TaxID=2512218 RepID=UPI001062FAD6|nr:carboxymuconolactone decarboxylase family protein [Kribbella sp. VKM Ac-2566]TDW81341.1 AhpD family alkylhydroperoxidase [Kribbella sp. VKM Ac-2566]